MCNCEQMNGIIHHEVLEYCNLIKYGNLIVVVLKTKHHLHCSAFVEVNSRQTVGMLSSVR